MSYVPLGNLCGLKNGAPFSNTPTPVKTVLLSNFGGASYAPVHDPLNPKTMYQCDGVTTFKTAYATHMNPYASAMCSAGATRSSFY